MKLGFQQLQLEDPLRCVDNGIRILKLILYNSFQLCSALCLLYVLYHPLLCDSEVL